jgi:DNA processing protein
MNERQKLAEWHLLSQCKHIGPVRFRNILAHVGANLALVFEMSERELQDIPGMPGAAACQIRSLKPAMGSALDFAEGQLERIEKCRGGFLTLDHPLYPEPLRQSPVCHPILYYRGDIRRLDPSPPSIAIVGSRNALPESLQLARVPARELAGESWNIVSGLALGTDAAAHYGALDADGMTVAVMGCGPDVPYTVRSRKLYEEIVERGVIISEFPFGTRPEPWRLIRRNKTIIGLSQAAFVVQSAIKGGAMNAAKACREQGKAIFTVAPEDDRADFSGNRTILAEFSGRCVSRCNAAAEIKYEKEEKRCLESP